MKELILSLLAFLQRVRTQLKLGIKSQPEQNDIMKNFLSSYRHTIVLFVTAIIICIFWFFDIVLQAFQNPHQSFSQLLFSMHDYRLLFRFVISCLFITLSFILSMVIRKKNLEKQDNSYNHERHTDSFESLAIGISSMTGDAFFHSLAEHLSRILNMSHVFIGEFNPGSQTIKTIVVYFDGQFTNNFSYLLSNTPCEDVSRKMKSEIIYNSDVQQLFPNDIYLRNIKASSFIGLPLYSPPDNFLGMIVLADSEPITNLQQIRSILRIFESKATAELRRLREERDYRQAADKLMVMFESITDAIITTDLTGILCDMNRATLKLFGVSSKIEYVGRNGFEFFAPKDRSRLQQQLRITLEHGRSGVHEYTLRKADGFQFNAEVSSVVLVDFEQEPTNILTIIHDITERKMAQETLLQSQKHESIATLAGGVAHDFNNFLNAILGQAALALQKMKTDHPSYKHVEKSMKAAERAADLVQQLLAYAGRGKYVVKEIDINTLLKNNLSLYSSVLPKSIIISTNFEESRLTTRGDPGQLEQVFLNIITNAGESIKDNAGKIFLRTSLCSLHRDDVRYWKYTHIPLPPGPYVLIQIDDTGLGIQPDILNRIFDPFFSTKFTGGASVFLLP